MWQVEKHTSITPVQTTVSSTINLLSDTQRTNKFKPANSTTLYIALLLLANAEDVETNPGPSIDTFSQSGDISSVYLCGACKEPVTWNDKEIMCESCESWFHVQC